MAYESCDLAAGKALRIPCPFFSDRTVATASYLGYVSKLNAEMAIKLTLPEAENQGNEIQQIHCRL